MRYKYSINNDNQLLITPPKSKTLLKPQGEFKINQNNQLEYWLNEPDGWRSIYRLPKKIVFEGKWGLNNNHDLELKLGKTGDQKNGERLTLKGNIISVVDNCLAFEISSHGYKSSSSFRILKLTGTWQADEFNRIVFKLERMALPDELVFGAAWKINKNQQIEYTYERIDLVKNIKTKQKIAFEGYWKILSSRKLTFILSHNLDSNFDFRAQIENPNIYPKDGSIKYRLGAGIRQAGRSGEKLVILYGEWKFSRRLGLNFRMDYGNKEMKELEFGAEVTFERNKFLFSLKDEVGEPLGVTLTYSLSLLSSLEPRAFLRLKAQQEELGIEAGLNLPF